MTKAELEQLVDNYLAKHDAFLQAGYAYEAIRKEECSCSDRFKKIMIAFEKAHNDRAAAFRALKDSRKTRTKKHGQSF